MPTLRTNNASVHYEMYANSGPWLTLVNGYTRSSSDFRLFAKELNAAGIRCVAIDNRGSGETQLHSDNFSFQDWLDDIVAVWRQENIDKTSILGISMGGFIAQGLARGSKGFPHIEKLILVSTSLSRDSIHEPTPWSNDIDAVERKMQSYFSAEFLANNKLLVKSMAKQIVKNIVENNFMVKAEMQRQALSTMPPITKDTVHNHNIPVLIIHGDEDRVISVAEAYKLEKAWKNSRAKIFPGAGHLLLAERAKELRSEVIDFLLA